MKIEITGSASKKLKHELTEAAEFFAEQLLDPRMARNITLDIEVIKDLDVNGECVNEDDNKNPRWFTINLKKNPKNEDIFQVLAHEMVHLKQYAKNELSKTLRIARGTGLELSSIWMGEVWKPKGKEDSYWDSPWEIAAYGMEVGLMHKWCSRHDPKMPWYVGEGA